MLSDILWTILGLIGLAVVITIIWVAWISYKIRKRMRALVKTFDHHPANPTRKEVVSINSETIDKDN